MTENELEKALNRLPLSKLSVIIEGRPGRWVAVVSTPDFGAMEDHKRQELVWEHLLRSFAETEVVEVEFIFTLTPDEYEASMQAQQTAG